MGKVKCFDVVKELVEEANKQFAPLWRVDNEKYKVLENYCAAIDKVVEEFDGESIDVEIDDIKMTVHIALEFYDIIIEESGHLFYKLAERAMSINFSQETDDLTRVEFVFPPLWDKA